jgi:3-demethoxyubiquinol 3-hydroxylase
MRVTNVKAFAARILKVNHAGENGAVNIYAGQIFLARLTAPSMVAELQEFKAHEQKHRAIFMTELQRRGQRRCRSYWLCGAGGLVLGVITGAFGRSAIAATTVAVEHVVLGHLEQQLRMLGEQDQAATQAISAIVNEERQHHDQSAKQVNPSDFWSRVLTPVVSASTEAVIWIGMRV